MRRRVLGPARIGAMTDGRIFVSYRREETAYPAGWLFDRLEDHYGAGQVFKDIDSIDPGDDFVDRIAAAVASCDVLLVLIGSRWLGVTDAAGARRIDDPRDFVRVEVEAALARGVRVIPVLVDDARMPAPEQLPETLAPLARRQALELRPSHFDFETSRLVKVIDETLADRRAPAPPSRRRRAPLVAAGAAAVALVAVALALVARPGSNGAPARAGVIFADDFSTRAGGWDDAGPNHDGGHYEDGAYRLYSQGTPDHFSDAGFPRGAAGVFPRAPRDIAVAVTALRTLGADQDTSYGLVCRASATSDSYSQFALMRGHSAIAKVTPGKPFYKELRSGDLSAVRPDGDNRLGATCATDASGAAVLAFTVNGKLLARATDGDRPLSAGTVGLVVATSGKPTQVIEVRYDDFAVTPAPP